MIHRRPKEDQNFWNFLFSVFFLAVLIAVMLVIVRVRGTFPTSVPLFDVILMAFASFRITRLVVYDKITRWFRELFADTREFEEGGITYIEIRPFGSGLRHTIHDLLLCPWCISFWSALVIVFCYSLFSWAWLIILFLALSGAGSLLQLVANAIGWRAENLKLTTREHEERLREFVDRSSLGN